MPLTLRQRVLDWYHLYIYHPVGGEIPNIIQHVCYLKGLFAKSYMSVKPCNLFQQFKNKNKLYGHLPPKIITKLKPCNLVNINLIGIYSNLIMQQKTVGAIIPNYLIFTCMTLIDPATGWFKIVQVPCFDI